ncbi:hypothetical protein [Bacteroides ilei]|mgnify:FL=1|uniref:hypothetical protein n=1 Tax=Bacteroides ilei TaxID=1907658 RepID=UPI0009311F36|nr:hypothetical protein [Bacteroides ilei]
MKTAFVKSIVLGLFVMASVMVVKAEEAGKDASGKNNAVVKVLVVGLDNVNSNYFPESMITEETGIPEDSIGETYNRIITDNIIQANKDKGVAFISSENISDADQLLGNVVVNGENEESYADVEQIDHKNYQQLMDEAQADYVLFLNQHYLKWQEKPLRTLFHFVSYSLYDKNQQEVTKGNNYFTCMNLEKADRLTKASRKSSSKIASAIVKSIDK